MYAAQTEQSVFKFEQIKKTQTSTVYTIQNHEF